MFIPRLPSVLPGIGAKGNFTATRELGLTFIMFLNSVRKQMLTSAWHRVEYVRLYTLTQGAILRPQTEPLVSKHASADSLVMNWLLYPNPPL